jgi:hypothetical protein
LALRRFARPTSNPQADRIIHLTFVIAAAAHQIGGAAYNLCMIATPNSSLLTLCDKLWNDHVVDKETDGTACIPIDRHLAHGVTSPPTFWGLVLLDDALLHRAQNADVMVATPRIATHATPSTDLRGSAGMTHTTSNPDPSEA